MEINFCTYFDSAYLTKARVCHYTLMSHSNARFFILCFDRHIEQIVYNWKNTIVITLKEIETYEPKLLAVKNKRSKKEYYATITPILPQFIFDKFGIETLFYTDADMAFWSPAEEIFEVMGNYSLLITPHENPIAVRCGGVFNVGILGYKNDKNCREFLEWWEDRCLERCEWQSTSDGHLADQGYLNVFHQNPGKFRNVLSCPQFGINLGPWNLVLHETRQKNGKIILDDKYNLVCFHYHGCKEQRGECFNDTGWQVSEWNRKHIYQPYYRWLLYSKNGILE